MRRALLVLSLLSPATSLAANPYFPEASVCEWPTSVTFPVWSGEVTDPDGDTHDEVRSGCGAAWLGNGWFATAGHCVEPPWTHGIREDIVRFGNHTEGDEFEWEADVDLCETYPGGEWVDTADGPQWVGPDVAICRIEGDDWPDLPAVPVLVPSSCENDYIRHLAFYTASAQDPEFYPSSPYGYGMNAVAVEVAGHGFEKFETDVAPDGDCEVQSSGNCDCALQFGDCANGNKRIVRSYLFSETMLGTTRVVPFVSRRVENDGVDFVTALGRWDDWPDSVSFSESGFLEHGDSGSPMFFEMEDGTWRTIGVGSALQVLLWREAPDYTEEFYPIAGFAPLPVYLPWMQQVVTQHDAGLDLTPCHTLVNTAGVYHYDYTWTAACQAAVADYALNPDSNSATWSNDTCALSQGGDDFWRTRECAGWSKPLGEAAGAAPTQGQNELALALDGVVQAPAQVLLDLPNATPWYGTAGADTLTVPSIDPRTTVELGAGNDSLTIVRTFTTVATVEVSAGAGDDLVVSTGTTNDQVRPGFGRDTVQLGNSTDTLLVMGGCELVAGETWDGGAGVDTLVSPLSACDLAKRGIYATGFEAWRPTHASADAAYCARPGTYPPVTSAPDRTQVAMIAALCR